MNSGNDSSDDDSTQHKIIVLGNGAVGKTSLIQRYCNNAFAQSYKQTIGVDFFVKKLSLPKPSGGGFVNTTLHIWDIGGQQIGGKMLAKYIYGSEAVIYVYDVTNPDSFKDITDWMVCVQQALEEEAKQQGGEAGQPKPRIVSALVGNKVDLTYRQVTVEEHTRTCSEYNLASFFVSAKTGELVQSLFESTASILERLASPESIAAAAPSSQSKAAATTTATMATMTTPTPSAVVHDDNSKRNGANVAQFSSESTGNGASGDKKKKKKKGDCALM